MRRKDREVTDIREIERILSACKTCHVAMFDHFAEGEVGFPYIVPLSYGYKIFESDRSESGTLELYFHSALTGKKIDLLKKNPRVCFEISREGNVVCPEDYCQAGIDFFESVIGRGEVIFLDGDEKRGALAVMFAHQTGKDALYGDKLPDEEVAKVCVFKIVAGEFTGKRK